MTCRPQLSPRLMPLTTRSNLRPCRQQQQRQHSTTTHGESPLLKAACRQRAVCPHVRYTLCNGARSQHPQHALCRASCQATGHRLQQLWRTVKSAEEYLGILSCCCFRLVQHGVFVSPDRGSASQPSRHSITWKTGLLSASMTESAGVPSTA